MGAALLYCLAAWIAPLFIGVISTGVIAGSTSKLGASAVGPWMLLAMLLQVLYCIAASVTLYKRVRPLLQRGWLIGLVLVHAAVQLALLTIVVFATLVMFNR